MVCYLFEGRSNTGLEETSKWVCRSCDSASW